MNAARILYPVRTLGPGERIGLWLAGCRRACPGCINPDLWQQRPEYEYTPEELARIMLGIAREHPVDGFTISGGEPMDQAEELCRLLTLLAPVSTDVLIYTGYTLEELQQGSCEARREVLRHTAVLIDGPYIRERNTGCRLRGSGNQCIRFLNEAHRPRLEAYLAGSGNQVQNFACRDGVVSVGIHRPGYVGDMNQALGKEGILLG